MTLDAIVIGGGQAGLAAGYWLSRRGLEFEILDAAAEVGHSWRSRWDSLQLFTPAIYSELPGMAFPTPPGDPDRFWTPSKDQMANYLEAYAERFSLPVRLNSRVGELTRDANTYVAAIEHGEEVSARTAIVATGAHQTQKLPPFAPELDPRIETIGSLDYRRPEQLSADRVLVVGAGASGVDIAFDLAASGRQVTLAGPSLMRLPRRLLGLDLYWWLEKSGILGAHCDRLPGRWICAQGRRGGDELIGLHRGDFSRAGIRRAGRVTGVRDGRPAVEGGEVLDAGAVVWCAGLGYEFDRWIELPVLDEEGLPVNERGVIRGETALFVVGLPYEARLDSGLVGGVGRDAEHVVDCLAQRLDAAAMGSGPTP